jgi:hypothetical protein
VSLSDRLRAAEQQRRSSTTTADDTTLDLTSSDAAVIDLTARRQQSSGSRTGPGSESTLEPYRFEPGADEPVWAAGAEGISYNPVRDGDATKAFDDPTSPMADRTSTIVCPRCGGATQIDLFDQVHQTTSLSCLTCFHMFRVEADT